MQSPTRAPWNNERLKVVFVCLLLAGTAFLVYAPTLWHGPFSLDDDAHIFKNPHVLGGLTLENLRWAFGFKTVDYWHPLSNLSLMLDAQVFGLAAGGFHFTNVLLHSLNAALLFLLFLRMTGRFWPSAFVAALFAFHPMHVESVAWATARKDVLSTLFWLLATLAYTRFAENPSAKRYLPCAILLALGLMSKSMLVTLPCTLLLLDFWPLGRTRFWTPQDGPRFSQAPISRLVLEKLPLFALSLASAAVTWLTHPAEETTRVIVPSMALRLANAAVSYVHYLAKFAFPVDIAVIHPFPQSVPAWQWAGSLALLTATTLFVVRHSRARPHLLVGWLWFLGVMVPVLKLNPFGLWYSFAARFTYVPYIGLYAMAAFEAPLLAGRLRIPPKALAAIAGLILAALALDARIHVNYWSDSLDLFRHAAAVTEKNFMAHQKIAAILVSENRPEEALPHAKEALRINPNDPELHYLAGRILKQLGRPQEAIAEFQEAIRLDPRQAVAHDEWGQILGMLGRHQEALAHFQEALRLDPNLPEAHNNMGITLAQLGRPDAAVPHLQEAIRLRPDFTDAVCNLAWVMFQLGKTPEAVRLFQAALASEPNSFKIHYSLGQIYAQLGLREEAARHLLQARKLKPGSGTTSIPGPGSLPTTPAGGRP